MLLFNVLKSPIKRKGENISLRTTEVCISVTNTVSRLYDRMLRNLIEKDFEEDKEDEKSCFRTRRSCTDVFFLNRCVGHIEKHISFLKLHKAYDSVPIFILGMDGI